MSFWDRNKGWIIFLAVVLLISLIAYEAKGQSCSSDYGCALFYRTDAWTRDGLVEHWVFDPGVQGDYTNGSGDFESFKGADMGCTNCPTDWECDCTTFGGDVDDEMTHIYRSDTSVKITPAGFLTGILYHMHTFVMNEVYQFSFCYRGGTGTEDLNFGVGNISFTDTYDWTADSFTAPLTVQSFTNIGTVWTCANMYMTVGPNTKSNFLVAFAAGTADGTDIYIDNARFSRVNAESVTGARGNVLSVPTTSDQQWGHSEEMLPRTGTGPAYKTGMKLDGTDDYLSCADGTCEMDPVNWAGGGYFSVGCRVITDTVAATVSMVSSKYAGAGTRSWLIRRSTADLEFYVSDDGTNTDSNGVTVFTAGALYGFVSTFNPSGGSGACENNIYYDAYQVDTDATLTECGPFDSAAAFEMGSYNSGSSPWDGSILECSLWEKELSAIEANKYISPYFPGTDYNDGFYVDTCSQAASHATCSTQKCRDGTPNACQAEGTGVMAIFDGYTELVQNNSFETNAGTDDSPTFTNWTVYAGEGTTNLTAYHADTVHEDISARLVAESGGGNSYFFLVSDCMTVTGGNDYYAYIKAKMLECTGECYFYVLNHEYSDGACTNWVHTHNVATSLPNSSWGEQGMGFTVDAAANSMEIEISVYSLNTVGGKMEALVDTVSAKKADYRTPWNENPAGAGTTSYNSRQYELHNPLSDYCESEDGYCYASGFCVSAWVYTDWVGDDGVAHFIIQAPGTVGNNNRWIIRKTGGNDLYFDVYDGAGGQRTCYLNATSINWIAGGWNYVEVCSNNTDNVLRAHHYNFSNSTWYSWSNITGAGTGIQNGQAADLHIGHGSNTNYLDGFIPEIHISPYSAIYPNIGFNSGIPPINHAPY